MNNHCILSFLFVCCNLFSQEPLEKYVIGSFPGFGFGASLTQVLNTLCYCEYYCEKNNHVPVVYWGSDSVYYNPEGFNGENLNAWNYYFEPVSSLKYNVGDIIGHETNGLQFYPINYYDRSEENRILANKIILKYIKPNAIVQSKIDNFYNKHLFGRKTIGIHLRGTDKYTEEKPVSAFKMVKEALKYADKETQFLIATDEKKLLDDLIYLLGKRKVIYYECDRAENGKPLHFLSKGRSKRDIAQNGEDILVEIILLSKCNVFISTLSNVSAIVLYFNPYLKQVTLK